MIEIIMEKWEFKLKETNFVGFIYLNVLLKENLGGEGADLIGKRELF